MNRFAKLLEKLLFTPSRNAKIVAMAEYFENTPDPDRGFALGAITRDLSLNNLKPPSYARSQKAVLIRNFLICHMTMLEIWLKRFL